MKHWINVHDCNCFSDNLSSKLTINEIKTCMWVIWIWNLPCTRRWSAPHIVGKIYLISVRHKFDYCLASYIVSSFYTCTRVCIAPFLPACTAPLLPRIVIYFTDNDMGILKLFLCIDRFRLSLTSVARTHRRVC